MLENWNIRYGKHQTLVLKTNEWQSVEWIMQKRLNDTYDFEGCRFALVERVTWFDVGVAIWSWFELRSIAWAITSYSVMNNSKMRNKNNIFENNWAAVSAVTSLVAATAQTLLAAPPINTTMTTTTTPISTSSTSMYVASSLFSRWW